MSMKYLGEHFDIHGGGQDLIFPHHENEIAQSEAATGKPFANFWTENGMVNLAGEKMSKSTGNLFFIEEIASRFDPEVVRYYLLSTHYRSPIEFSEERLAEAAVAHQRLRSPLERCGAWKASDGVDTPPGGALKEAVAEAESQFGAAMDDDFNSARAIGHLFDFSRQINRALDQGAGAEARSAARILLGLGGVLGLFWKAPAGETWDSEVLELVDSRERARKARDWKSADDLRARLLEHGVLVEDGPQGPKLRRKD
jgi:cysteinyl-tRNA synthetase